MEGRELSGVGGGKYERSPLVIKLKLYHQLKLTAILCYTGEARNALHEWIVGSEILGCSEACMDLFNIRSESVSEHISELSPLRDGLQCLDSS